MENTQKLISFLNNFCDKYQQDNAGCDGNCPNFKECKTDIWEDADTELKEHGVEVL